MIDGFESDHPGTSVELYRAPTGELNAGWPATCVGWTAVPTSSGPATRSTVQDYVDQGLVGGWTPRQRSTAEYRTDDYVGVALLYMVERDGQGVPRPPRGRT